MRPNIRIVIDKRSKTSSKTYPISLCITFGKKTWFISLKTRCTPKEFEKIFNGSPTEHQRKIRDAVIEYHDLALNVASTLNPFDYKRFKELFKKADELKKPKSVFLDDIFNRVILEKKAKGQISSAHTNKLTLNSLNNFRKNIQIVDVNLTFLREYEHWLLLKFNNEMVASIGIHMRNLRTIINLARNEELLPIDFKYPFGRGKYTPPTKRREKVAHSKSEILKIVQCTDFASESEAKSRDIWLMLFYCNGLNFIDLLSIRWVDIKEGIIYVIRQKTKQTNRNIKPIRIPLINGLKKLIDKHGDKNSPYVLGFLKSDMNLESIHNKKKKLSKQINKDLDSIGTRLGLNEKLKCQTARYAYATFQKNEGASISYISEQLGHSNISVTQNYLSGYEVNDLFQFNDKLPQ